VLSRSRSRVIVEYAGRRLPDQFPGLGQVGKGNDAPTEFFRHSQMVELAFGLLVRALGDILFFLQPIQFFMQPV
jgi:hypothetical protein